ncbi:MAG: DUF933 domain-containing protein [Gemmatimonadales bacterium]
MEILIRDRNYANVRLPDGTEGWVKSAYLVDEKPARLIVAETMAERDRLAAELKAAREAGAVRFEGKEYAVRDGDILWFRTGA